MGRDHDHDVPRGVTAAHRLLDYGVVCSIASNNVLNPFTPFGDCSLIRMANFYANVAQIGRPSELAACLDMVTTLPAKLMNLRDYGIAVGNPADLVVLDCVDRAGAVAEIARPLFGMKNGRRTFVCPPARLLRGQRVPATLSLSEAGKIWLEVLCDRARAMAMPPLAAPYRAWRGAYGSKPPRARRRHRRRSPTPSLTTVRPATISSRICRAVARVSTRSSGSISSRSCRRRSRPSRAAKCPQALRHGSRHRRSRW